MDQKSLIESYSTDASFMMVFYRERNFFAAGDFFRYNLASDQWVRLDTGLRGAVISRSIILLILSQQ